MQKMDWKMMTKVARKQLERVVPLMLFHSIANGLGMMNGWSIKPQCHLVRRKKKLTLSRTVYA